MKRLLSLILALAFCFVVAACAKDGTDAITTPQTTLAQNPEPPTCTEEAPLLAGFAEVDITPTELGQMPGGFEPVQAMAVVAPLYSNVAAFTSGDESVILISMDHLSFHEEYGNNVRKRISEATGVPTTNILFAATHTHSGMAVEYQLWFCPPELEDTARAADLTVEAAVRAWESRAPMQIGTGTTYNSRYSYCRDWYMKDGSIKMNPGVKHSDLVKPISTPDYYINVMRVDDLDGDIKCFIVNYANHPDCTANDIGYSPDFPGFIRERLKKEYGEDTVVLYFNGAAGDVNCIDWKNGTHTEYYKGINSPKNIGYGIAESIIRINSKIVADDTTPLIQALDEKHATERRKKTQEQYEWAMNIYNSTNKGQYYNGSDKVYMIEYATEDDSQLPDTVDLEIHTIQIGDWAIVGLPSEIYSEIGRHIKEASPYKTTLVFSLTNGTHGYICPDYILDAQPYEAIYSKYNSYTGWGTEDMLVRESKRMLTEMYNVYKGK